jgi:hypothetical protein
LQQAPQQVQHNGEKAADQNEVEQGEVTEEVRGKPEEVLENEEAGCERARQELRFQPVAAGAKASDAQASEQARDESRGERLRGQRRIGGAPKGMRELRAEVGEQVAFREEFKWGPGGARLQRGWLRPSWGRSRARARARARVLEDGDEEVWDEDDAESQPLLLLASHPRSHYIIPPDIARPLVVSSTLLLLQAVAALAVCVRGAPPVAYALPPLLCGTYLTSSNFWRNPSASNRWRYADYGMVTLSVLYGTYVVQAAAPSALLALWCRGWSAIAALFVANEAKFWLNKAKRRHDYVLAVWVHLVVVHLFGNALVACALGALGFGWFSG